MRKLKQRYWMVPLAIVFALCFYAIEAFRSYDRALSRDLQRLGILVKNPPGIALEDWLK